MDKKQEVGKGKARFDGNTGLSCSDCKIHPCTNCKQSDQYEPDTITNGNIRKLKMEKKGGENISIICLENKSQVTQTVLTTPKVAPAGSSTATIPQQGVFNSTLVIHQRPLPSTKPANPTVGPSNPSGSDLRNVGTFSAIPTHVLPKKTKPGPGKRPLDAPMTGPSPKVSLYTMTCTTNIDSCAVVYIYISHECVHTPV